MFDPNGKVIMFAAATTFLCFTLSANYGLILFSGAPYLEVMELDWNARSSMLWFEVRSSVFLISLSSNIFVKLLKILF